MARYWLSLIIVLAGTVYACFASGLGRVLFLVDIPSLIAVGILPFFFISILFGFKNMASAFSVSFRKDIEKDKLINASIFFKLFGKTIWLAGLIAVLIGVIAILKDLGDWSALGVNLAIILISLFYSALLQLMIIIPFTLMINTKLKE
ncbi:hypothetical protein LJC14_02875 [Treponema sp. OttesenSCG-928-L16]|nr:hypothetical protein [Treponema sp. OttesenSCG-928-L16]